MMRTNTATKIDALSVYAQRLKRPPVIDYAKLTDEDLLRSQYLRLNTIYKIVDKKGRLRPFRMNAEQYHFYRNMHNLNIILKARQRGFTTLIQIYLLDVALFTPNTSCGIIAHNKGDAKKFFDKKVKLAWDNIPADFKRNHCPTAEQDAAEQLKFSNGSYISVGTSLRSDTVQYLHVSEFGKMCAKYPDKADEVVSGAFNTVAVGNWITIESTGEGAHGHFYEMAMTAKRQSDIGAELTPMDYKFFFYPWWEAREYTMRDHVAYDADDERYFDELEKLSGIELSRYQKNWYAKKQREQREKMWREYPSTPEEAFRGVIEGAPFSRVMANLRRQGRFCKVPWARNFPVYTFWDLGRNDKTAIWFMQHIGFEFRFIDYYENHFHALDHYAQILLSKPYTYAEHYLPHDAEVTELTRADNKTRWEVLEDLKIRPTHIVPRISSEMEAVNMTRNQMGNVWFDAEKCSVGITCLENVRFKFDKVLQEYQPNLQRTQHKHGADAFMQFGHGYASLQRRPRSDTLTSGASLARVNRGYGRVSRARNQRSQDWRT